MKLPVHVDHIRQLTGKAIRNSLGRMGITAGGLQPVESIPVQYHADRKRIAEIRESFIGETGAITDAYEKLAEEFTFTLFNRLAALKVMEAHTLHPEIVTRRSQHGSRSFAHLMWLQQNPGGRGEEMEGLVQFFSDQLVALANEIPLFSLQYPYHLLPTAIELNSIINAFNAVETDAQAGTDIWKSDDVLGWLYEAYQADSKQKLKDDKTKIEYDKVKIQSCVYTPRWVVKFLVDNSLGKLYLEMYPDSEIREKYKIANAPEIQIRNPKPLTEIKLIDPAPGSGNFLFYGFDLFYDLYTDQVENYGADYDENKIAEYIIRYNLYGVDLDVRAVQLAQLGLFIKAKRKKRATHIDHFNIVSSDFFLPDYDKVKDIFETNGNFDSNQKEIIRDVWTNLKNAHKFGSLVRIEEKLSIHLHGLTQQFQSAQLSFFTEDTLAYYEQFRENFFANLQKAVAQNTALQGLTFLNTKTHDAITYLQILSQKYDVSVANPPYTDSADFGPELKKFIDTNYKQPYKFNSNLYSVFIKRCSELVIEKGFIGMLHPLTFMYISTFKEVRKYILTNTHIEILAELGLGGVFANSDIQADVVAYSLKNLKSEAASIFLDFKKYKNHTNKPEIFNNVYDNLINNVKDDHIFQISQSSFKVIQDWPFIYWISDEFRGKFKEKVLDKVVAIRAGIQTSNNERFLRFWWEVLKNDLSENYHVDKKRWVKYVKGGPFNKWYGNIWLVIDWERNGQKIQEFLETKKLDLHAQPYYFLEGLTYSASGSKGISFRHLPTNHLFDIGGASIFIIYEYKNLNYLSGLLNSNLSSYIINSLNPTVNVQPVDLKRIPFVKPSKSIETQISDLALQNIEIKRLLCTYRIIETNYNQNPLLSYTENTLKDRLLSHLDNENAELTKVLLNETIINKLIFQVYELRPEDQKQVETNMGKSVGDLPLYSLARKEFFATVTIQNKVVVDHINNLPEVQFNENLIREIKNNFNALYQGNSNLEEFCIKYQINPINVWYWFKEARLLPESVPSEYSLEFLIDIIRILLMADDDGIIPLVGLPGEPRLLDLIEHYCLHNGFTSAQFTQLDSLLGKPVNQFIEHHFFGLFSDYIKLFKQMPSTPFIWHLSSGPQQGFDAYTIIYKWNRDSLFKLKTPYLEKRKEKLENRQYQLKDSVSAQAQNEKEKIALQLQEIANFTQKIDELIAEGYDPKLDDGVGKNIAPLQKKGLLRAEVLNVKQLERYLNADW